MRGGSTQWPTRVTNEQQRGAVANNPWQKALGATITGGFDLTTTTTGGNGTTDNAPSRPHLGYCEKATPVPRSLVPPVIANGRSVEQQALRCRRARGMGAAAAGRAERHLRAVARVPLPRRDGSASHTHAHAHLWTTLPHFLTPPASVALSRLCQRTRSPVTDARSLVPRPQRCTHAQATRLLATTWQMVNRNAWSRSSARRAQARPRRRLPTRGMLPRTMLLDPAQQGQKGLAFQLQDR